MIKAFAPAKINLALHVTGQRADGYHQLDSLVVFVDVGDRLTVETSAARQLTVSGPFAAGVPTGPDNLIWKAIDLLDPSASFAISLEKELPHGAGIGGGSSDAGAILRALCDARGRALPSPTRLLQLGADIPVCTAAKPARMAGIGEVLSPLPALPSCALVLVNPRQPVPTGAVFGSLARKENAPMTPPEWHDYASFLQWCHDQRNDLEPPARNIAPHIASSLEAVSAQPGCGLARMSGSGATCFGVFASLEAAQRAASELRANHSDWWITACEVLP